MWLISLVQISPWIFGGLCFLIFALSWKEILSPIFTIILLVMLGGSFFLLKGFFTHQSASLTENEPIHLMDDKISSDLVEDSKVLVEQGTKIEKNTSNVNEIIPSENKSSETKDISADHNSIPQEYEVIDKRLRNYKITSHWKWDKRFVDYFEKETGWKKIKKGNYEITIQPSGIFTQKMNDDERRYVYPGGEIEIRVNGKACCCGNTVSIPEGISHRQLVKAKGKLQDAISNLLLENKEAVVAQLRKCL